MLDPMIVFIARGAKHPGSLLCLRQHHRLPTHGPNHRFRRCGVVTLPQDTASHPSVTQQTVRSDTAPDDLRDTIKPLRYAR
jgi:hypothetical protein